MGVVTGIIGAAVGAAGLHNRGCPHDKDVERVRKHVVEEWNTLFPEWRLNLPTDTRRRLLRAELQHQQQDSKRKHFNLPTDTRRRLLRAELQHQQQDSKRKQYP